ncbi:3-hydroxyisobutyrate dehydrogenase [Chitinasiproducens palmae]|uniref:3-hydroxyisobutyrate dehydrogenase n=1 Tax=Chitinasiproducens palmae TaxID=1770053 RepID=A0A1H2PJU3_9BURK|nr:3-hydroxyisobutyrate dehydrogenase [Chitinasiproducens palmae]SDV46618.1 3-hydroxyisobutyrate dehydrogenase [Chitinasiproducens palmae]
MQIAFIGLGNMGAPMAANLLAAGHALRVCDLSEAAIDAACAQGATRAANPADAASDAELVMTMLPAAAHVRAVYQGEHGVLASVPAGIPLIDSSTIDPATVAALADAAARQGNPFVDAPVSGGTVGAQAGTLTFMVGADPALLERIAPVLAQMGRNVVRCGDTGTGQVAKLCNNLLLGISMIGVAEAMSLGEALGIDAQVLAGIINTSTGRCWSAEVCNPVPGIVANAPASRAYRGGFGVDLMLKDLGLAVDAARAARLALPLGALAEQTYRRSSRHGDGSLDFSSVIRQYGDAG